jgi:hypothetical protein
MLKGTLQFYIYNDECFLIFLIGFSNAYRYWDRKINIHVLMASAAFASIFMGNSMES